MRKKNLENMTRAELLETAIALGLAPKKNFSKKRLVSMVNEATAVPAVPAELPEPVIDVAFESEPALKTSKPEPIEPRKLNRKPKPARKAKAKGKPKPIEKVLGRRKNWASSYVLLCAAYVNDGSHAKGDVVELDDENARSLVRQGAIALG